MLTRYYKGKKVAVTGSSGFIGYSLVKKLQNLSANVTPIDKNQDIRNNRTLRRIANQSDIIFHLAAQTSSQYANQHPLKDLETNLIPIIKLIDMTRNTKKKPDIIFSGSSTQVGLTKHTPTDESLKDTPASVYDIHKLAAEKYLQYYSNQLNGRAFTLRLTNIYGPGPKSSQPDRGILNQMILKALREQTLTIYGEGSAVRDYLYVQDAVNAFLIAGTKINVLSGAYSVVGSQKGYTIKMAIETVKKIAEEKTQKEIKIRYIATPTNLLAINSRNFIADSSKFIKLTGWKPRTTLEKGITKTMDYLIENKKV